MNFFKGNTYFFNLFGERPKNLEKFGVFLEETRDSIHMKLHIVGDSTKPCMNSL